MSLNTTVTMSNNNATEKESSNALCRFPDKREREEFPNWLFKVKAFLDAKGLLGMVNKPIPGLPDSVDEQVDDSGLDTPAKKAERKVVHVSAKRAYNFIIQSLNTKQIELIRNVYMGNAHVVMNVLQKTYGIIKSTNNTMTLFQKLNTNKKLSTESMTDYIARIDRTVPPN